MPARKLPPLSVLRQMAQRMTHQEIADELSRTEGFPIARSTVSAALHRGGESEAAKKYPDEIPWKVYGDHKTHYAARMLRLLGRRNKGIQNSAEQEARLESWLGQLRDAGAVVVYFPETKDGFFYVPGEPDNDKGIPIIRDYEVKTS